MRKYLLYVFYFIFTAYIVFLISAKIHSPFWFHQPVYHIYELYPRICTKPYIKKKSPPRFGIFCKPNQILSYLWKDIDEESLNLCIRLLQGHYVDNNTHLYHINNKELENRLKIDTMSMLSIYYDTYRNEPAFKESLNLSKCWGIITSRPIYLFFLKHSSHNMRIHYFDFLCVHSEYHSKNIARNLVQTHIYNHPRNDPSFTGVYLMKKENELCKGVVPFIKTFVYTFLLKPTPIQNLPKYYRVFRLTKYQEMLWKTIYAEMMNVFDCAILSPYEHSIKWLTDERYIVYVCVYRIQKVEHIHGVYIFETTMVSWEHDGIERKNVLRLVASMIFRQKVKHDSDLLYYFRGFLHAIKYIVHDLKNIGILEIPQISHNHYLLSRWKERYELRNTSDMAYYFYNLIYPKQPLDSSNIIVIV